MMCFLPRQLRTTAPKIGESLKRPYGNVPWGYLYSCRKSLQDFQELQFPAEKISAGLPIGMQMIGDCFMERKILRAAHAYEKRKSRGF